MAYKETFWMACDSTEQLRAEYGPFHTRPEAEMEARKLGFGYLLRYEHLIGDDDDIQEVRCIFIELPATVAPTVRIVRKLHTRCASCGESAVHDEPWQAEVWADIHEFEHTRHRVRLFEQTRTEGLKEIGDWRASDGLTSGAHLDLAFAPASVTVTPSTTSSVSDFIGPRLASPAGVR